MFYKKNIKLPSSKEYSLKYDRFDSSIVSDKDDGIAKPNEVFETYNFSTIDGSLKDGYGFKLLSLPTSSSTEEVPVNTNASEILGLWTYKWHVDGGTTLMDYVYYMNSDKKIYAFVAPLLANIMVPIRAAAFNDVPEFLSVIVNDREALMIASPSDDMLVLTPTATNSYPNAPKLMSCCVHYDKIFAILVGERNAVTWSNNIDILTWSASDAKKIRLDDERGRLLKVISFNDTIYVFREYGITKISVYSLSSDFSIDHVYLSSSYIYPDSISICGDRVLFLTRDGLYSFTGNSVKKLDIVGVDRIEKQLSSKPNSVCYMGKYFLACKFKFDDESDQGCVNNAMFVMDISNESVQIVRGVDIKSFAVLDSASFSKLLVSFRGEHKAKIGELTMDGCLFSQPLSKAWSSPYSDLGYAGKIKKVEEVKLISRGNCNLVIKSENGSKTYSVSGSDKVQRIKTNVYGRLLKLSFIANSTGQKISNPELTFTVQ